MIDLSAVVNNICNLSDGIYEKGIKYGIKHGVDDVIDLMINDDCPDDKIELYTKQTKEYIEKRRKMIKESKLTKA